MKCPACEFDIESDETAYLHEDGVILCQNCEDVERIGDPFDLRDHGQPYPAGQLLDMLSPDL